MFLQNNIWRSCGARWPLAGRSSLTIARYCLVACILVLLGSSASFFLVHYPSDPRTLFQSHDSKDTRPNYFDILNGSIDHPIDSLIEGARNFHDGRLLKRSKDVASAASRYRERRGRHPPPGFDKWMEYALKNDAIVVEDFFDRVYKDIAPFWALDPTTIALQAASWSHIVRTRGGKTTSVGDTTGRVPWLQLWTKLVSSADPHLPDVDMPINYMDESRLLVPWDVIDKYVSKETASRAMPPTSNVIQQYTGLTHIEGREKPAEPEWFHKPTKYWDFARECCPPGSPSRDAPALDEPAMISEFPNELDPQYGWKGYVKNFTAASDPCLQPHLRTYHASFVEPVSMSTAKELIPLFGGSKLSMNNEILIPGAMYITEDAFYSGGDTHGPPWDKKKDGIVWRGVASGGRNKPDNWWHFQRHRLVEMLNGTTVSRMERNGARALSFELPPLSQYNFPRRRERKFGEWLSTVADAAFVDLLCQDKICDYVEPYFSTKESVPMKDQYENKFMPDADGNSFSARFRGLLLSTSLPLKSTVYVEWHDDRLVPWLHFAPLDNSFLDMYGVFDFFTRDQKGDAAAQMIAESGKEWAEKVLRHEDMVLYTWRLLLEFARVCDEQRDKLGFVEDLLSAQT
ncbi:capsule associated protein [Apodospora peruviana]|uniref:Capsule associated protein n=1 Tax=Apodospora peruviana TaxID=516989 RepID=A0AAE0MAM0_9PEZI|nr:capsule associated protein [Apodospora peruviana]